MYSNEMYHAAYNILSARAEQLDEDELYHHGILGQKWGIRRYQNEDGTLTPAGKRKYKKADKIYEKDKEKYGFKDSTGRIRNSYREYYSKHGLSRAVKNINSLGQYDKQMRKNMQMVKSGGNAKQNVRIAKIRSAFSPQVLAANVATYAAGTAATTAAKNYVKKKLNDPQVQADLYAMFKRKAYGYVPAEGHVVPDIAGYLPGK